MIHYICHLEKKTKNTFEKLKKLKLLYWVVQLNWTSEYDSSMCPNHSRFFSRNKCFGDDRLTWLMGPKNAINYENVLLEKKLDRSDKPKNHFILFA